MKKTFLNKNMSIDWLMQNNREFVYYLLKCSKKNPKNNKFLDYAMIYQDNLLLKESIKKGEDINRDDDNENSQDITSSLYKAINSGFNVEKIRNENTYIEKDNLFSDYEQAYMYKIYNLKYNIDFIKSLFAKGFVNKSQEDNVDLFVLMVNKLAKASSLIRWEDNFLNNLTEHNKLLETLKDNQFKINNIEIIKNFSYIVSNFKNIQQLEVFYPWLDDNLLSESDDDGNNFLHRFIEYLNSSSEKIIDCYKNKYDFEKKLLKYPFICVLDDMGYYFGGNKNSQMMFSKGQFATGKSVFLNEFRAKELVCTDLYNYLDKFIVKLSLSPYYEKALTMKNKEGFTPMGLVNKELSGYVKSKIMYNDLKEKLNTNKIIIIKTSKI